MVIGECYTLRLSVNAVALAAATAAGAVEVYCVCALQKAKTTNERTRVEKCTFT